MNSLTKITLATILGASTISGCSKPYQTISGASVNEIIGVPVSLVERSPADGYAKGSYSLFMAQDIKGEQRRVCVYRFGGDLDPFPGYDAINRKFEFEALLLNDAREGRDAITFKSGAETPEGCLVIHSDPKLYMKR